MNQRPNTVRQGAVLICVLVCVGIASTILLTSVTASLRARRQMRQELQLEQTRWLIEAGMIRGIDGIRAKDNYQGETWNVGEAFGGYASAEVSIAVTTAGLEDGEVGLDITAEIGGSDPRANATRRSARLVVARSDLESNN